MRGAGKQKNKGKLTKADKLLGWHGVDEKVKAELVTVVLRNMFHPNEFLGQPGMAEELEADVKAECSKMGAVEKVSWGGTGWALACIPGAGTAFLASDLRLIKFSPCLGASEWPDHPEFGDTVLCHSNKLVMRWEESNMYDCLRGAGGGGQAVRSIILFFGIKKAALF